MSTFTSHRNVVRSLKRSMPLLIALGGVGMGMNSAQAQSLTVAGTSINNQAQLSYLDSAGISQNVSSNAVSTVVQQVGAVDIEADMTRPGTPLAQVMFPHTITNTGNGADFFRLSASDLTAAQQAGDNFNIVPLIYKDEDNDGRPDGLVPLPITQTPTLQAGQSYHVVVVGTVPLLATGSGYVRVTATSDFNSGSTDSNLDRVAVTSGPNISVVKSVSQSSGLPGTGPYTYTLQYTNNSNTAATNLNITDILPSGVTYVPGSGRWSGASSVAMSDTDGATDDPTGVNYSYGSALIGVRSVGAKIASIPANSTGTISFAVTLSPSVLPGIVKNFATYNYDTNLLPLVTNTVDLTVLQPAIVTFVGLDQATATQGSVISFNNVLTNLTTRRDAFNVVINNAASTFPAGTTFALYKSDGVTPLADTNGDTIPDTGELALLDVYNVILKATLPAGYTGTGPFSVTKTAISITDPATRATATDTLGNISSNSITTPAVDLMNSLAGLGQGLGPELNPVTTLLGDGGTTVRFNLYVKNNSGKADNFDLSAGATAALAALPLGVKVTFRSEAGTTITNTGTIAAGATAHVYADVELPTNIAAGALPIFFKVTSPVTGILDTKLDQITVNSVRRLAINPATAAAQIYAGGSVVYAHTITNTGLFTEGGGGLNSTIALNAANGTPGFTSVIYRDANNNGQLDDSDPVVTSLDTALAPGQSATVFVKVTTPVGAISGTPNQTTLTATTTGGLLGTIVPAIVSAIDTTTVNASLVTIDKYQALDANNDGAPDVSYTKTALSSGATPGKSIRYQIVIKNNGTAPATDVKVYDNIPAHTVYDTADGTPAADGTPDAAVWYDGTTYHPAAVAPANGSAGTLRFDVGTLNPGQTVTITFGVKIQ